jgi:hypothetical protein
MFAFSLGCRPVQAVRAAAPLIVAAAGLCAAGCAANHSTYNDTLSAAAYVAQGPSVQIEEDGMPSQAAPAARIRQMPVDPSQPYSRDYGGPNPASTIPAAPTVKASNDVAPPRPPIPYDLPPAFRRQLAAAVDAAG